MGTVKINSIHMENFKGFSDVTLVFHGKTSQIIGRNASGKTTVATACNWVFTDKDIDLNSNPDVKPLGVKECSPVVTIRLDIDGKEIEIAKSQKIKSKEEDGVIKYSNNNTYFINCVPKTEREFKASLEELGIPTTEELLLMIHTDAFAKLKKADQRNILFKMVEDITDKDVANSVEGLDDLKKLLETYELEEIEMREKATIKKIKEQLENIPGQIEGLELAKSKDVDISECELLINENKAMIAQKKEEIDSLNKKRNRRIALGQQILKLNFDRSTELEFINRQARADEREIMNNIEVTCNQLVDIKRHINVLASEEKQFLDSIKSFEDEIEEMRIEFDNVKAQTFNEKDLSCPTCKRLYPPEKQYEIKNNFEKQKGECKEKINIAAKAKLDFQSAMKKKLEDVRAEKQKAEKDLKSIENLNQELNEKLESYKPKDVPPTPKLIKIDKEIEECTKEREELKTDYDSEIKGIENTISIYQHQIEEANKKIGINENNIRIDEQIENLTELRVELEQNKANSERILYQAEQFMKIKNEMLTDKINAHFSKVKFSLFSYLKNGAYRDDCQILSLDGKEFGVATNTALEMAMKIDICQSFQKYRNMNLPIFVDGAESFDTATYNTISTDNQMIYLAVCDKDLDVVN